MADGVHKFSEQVIDLAERLADVADAANGKGIRKGGTARWLILPAAGAGLYALAASGSLTRHAKGVANQAKERASETFSWDAICSAYEDALLAATDRRAVLRPVRRGRQLAAPVAAAAPSYAG